MLVRAQLLRRLGRVDGARLAYREALEDAADDVVAVELFVGASMLLERPLGDLQNALTMAEAGHRLLRSWRASWAGALGPERRLDRRVERLSRAAGE